MATIRQARAEDIAGILTLEAAAYPALAQISSWKSHHLARHQEIFPEGQVVAEEGGQIVGHSASFITHSRPALSGHTFREITERGTFEGHDAAGNTLYGAELMVHPDFKDQGIRRALYDARFSLVRRFGLRFFVAPGRLPGLASSKVDNPRDYVDSVVQDLRRDPVLTPQLQNGLRVRGVLLDYLDDPKSRNNAALLYWENPDFAKATPSIRVFDMRPDAAWA